MKKVKGRKLWYRMPKIVHKQKSPFGGEIYLDENFRVIGHAQKGLFGEEVILDKDFKYVGSKQKGLFGEDVYLDKDFHVQGYGRKGLGDTRVYVDKDGHYAGWGSDGLGSEVVVFLDGNRSGEREPVTRRGLIGAWIFLAVVLGLLALFVWMILK